MLYLFYVKVQDFNSYTVKYIFMFLKYLDYNFTLKMKQNNQSNTLSPNPNFFSIRQRLNSMNSPFISPLRIVQSPIMNNFNTSENLFDFHLRTENFQLQPQNALDVRQQQEQIDDDSSSQSERDEQDSLIEQLNQNNLLNTILKNINTRDSVLSELINKSQKILDPFLMQLFEYLLKKFKGMKKTKEEMIKYSVRKAFRSITDKLRKQMPNYAVDSNEYLQYYFNKYQSEDQVTIPFKKDSIEKTINTAFLRKIFLIDKFVIDYKHFLKSFRKEYQKDNQKKTDAMQKIIKQCIKNKNFKGLDNFKRLPWTYEIFMKLDEVSKGLLEYASKKSSLNSKVHENEEQVDEYERLKQQEQIKKSQDSHKEQIKVKMKSIIVLTPPIRPMSSPSIPDIK